MCMFVCYTSKWCERLLQKHIMRPMNGITDKSCNPNLVYVCVSVRLLCCVRACFRRLGRVGLMGSTNGTKWCESLLQEPLMRRIIGIRNKPMIPTWNMYVCLLQSMLCENWLQKTCMRRMNELTNKLVIPTWYVYV